MRVVILAAGQSKRFQEEGYAIPKPFIQIDWRNTNYQMLMHVLNTIPVQFDQIAVAVPLGWISEGKRLTGIPEFYEVNSRGPADSAYQVLQHVKPDDTLIMDVDVLNWTNDLYRLTQLNCCGVMASWSANPSFSYVEKLGPFDTILEKERISEFAVRGAYYVPGEMRAQFMLRLEKVIAMKREPFISHAFNYMEGGKIANLATYTPVEWGTPRDVRISGAHIITNKGRLRCSQ